LEKLIADNYETIAAVLVQKVCRKNLAASEKVLVVLLKGLCKATFDNVQPYLDVIHEFMLIDDEHQDLRMKWMLGKEALCLSNLSKTILAFNSYNIEERLYSLESTYQLEHSYSLLDPIFQYYKKFENFSILCLR